MNMENKCLNCQKKKKLENGFFCTLKCQAEYKRKSEVKNEQAKEETYSELP